jgi:trigger factor
VHTQRGVLRDKVVEYVVNEVEFDLPEALLSAEVDGRVRSLVARLKESEISIEDYLDIIGQDEATFIATTSAEAERALSMRIILESISAIEGWEVEDDELVDHVVSLLSVSEEEAAKVVDGWKADGQVEALTGDILRERALASLVDSATAVDSDGDPVDLTPVVIEPEEEKNEDEPEAEQVEGTSEASDTDQDAVDESEEQG